jgi:hypothetical protein
MSSIFEETKKLVDYSDTTKRDVRESMYSAIFDLKAKIQGTKAGNYELLELLYVVSKMKNIIDSLSTVGVLSEKDWVLQCEMLRQLDSSCRNLMDMNDEMEEGE